MTRPRWASVGWIAVGLAWAVYLAVSNDLAIRLLRDPGDVVPTRAPAASANAPGVPSGLDLLEVFPRSPLDKTEIEGWVAIADRSGRFVERRQGADLRVVLVFDGVRNRYHAETSQKSPAWIDTGEEGGRELLAIRFSTMVIPVKMRHDRYRLGVVVLDGTTEVAHSWTDRRFVSDRRGWKALPAQP